MTKLLTVLICVFVLQFSKASCQTNWKYIATNVKDCKFYFNTKIVRRKTSAVVWIKCESDPDSINVEREIAESGPNWVRYDKWVSKQIIDFKNSRIQTLSLSKSLKGVAMHEWQTNEKKAVWDDIVPETIMDKELIILKKYLHIKN